MTDLSFNQHLDCTGVCDGPFRADSCDVCQLPNSDTGHIIEYLDCTGVCWGNASTDTCRVCTGGTTGITANATMDTCGVCDGDNSTCYGCDGVLNSGKELDTCSSCGGNDCGCFHVTSISPHRGPRSGGTHVTIKGAGFFRNSSHYNTSLSYCGGSVVDEDDRAIPITCQFQNDIRDVYIGPAYIVNQNTIICISPILAGSHSNEEYFEVRIKIEDGPFSQPISYYYDDYTVTMVTEMFPRFGPINEEIQLNFRGRDFLNTSDISCLIYNVSTPGIRHVSVPVQFINASSVYCLLPPSLSPCEVNVHLTLDGQVSGTIASNISSQFIYAYSAPVIEVIYFTDNLTSLIVSLDRSSHLTENRTMSCGTIFSNSTLTLLGGEDTHCYWANIYQRAVQISLPSTASLEIDSPIIFKDDVIATRGQSYSFEVTDSIYNISNRVTAVKPVIILIGPTSIPRCGSVTFIATNSYYQGYKQFLYKWSIYTTNSTIPGFLQLVNILNDTPSRVGEIHLPTNLFQTSVEYTLHLKVTNSIGLSSIETRLLTKSISSSLLQVAITGPRSITTEANIDLLIEGHVINNECTVPDGPLTYQWKLYSIVNLLQHTLQLMVLPNVTLLTSPVLFIPQRTLNVSTSYELHLTVTTNSQHATDITSVSVMSSQCTTGIHGGDRNVSSNGTIVLNAISNLQGELVSYMWTCSVLNTGSPCYNTTHTRPVIITIPHNKLLRLSAVHLQYGLQYNFTLIDTQGHCSPSTAIIGVTPSSSSPIAVVQILIPHSPVTISQSVVLEGLVYSVYPITTSWFCINSPDQGYIDLNNYTLSPITYNTVSSIGEQNEFENGILLGRTSRTNLVIRSNSLQPGQIYTFQLTATYNQLSVFTRVTVQAGSPPVVHQVTITPRNGIELSTNFKVSVDWSTDNIRDYPLYYQYGLLRGHQLYWLTGLTSSNTKYFILPSGSNITLYTDTHDRSMNEHFYTQDSVTVSPATIDYTSQLDSLNTYLADSKEWPEVMSKLIAILLSVEGQMSPSLTASTISLYSTIFNHYTPLTAGYSSLMLTTLELLTDKLPLTEVDDKITLLTDLNLILDNILKEIESNFVPTDFNSETDSNGNPLHLSSDRVSFQPLHRGATKRDIQAIVNTISNILSSPYNARLAAQLRLTLLKVSSVFCQQAVLGEPSINTSTDAFNYTVIKTIPFGTYSTNGNDAIITLSNILEPFYNQMCPHVSSTCTDICLQFTSTDKDYFTGGNLIIDITDGAREMIQSSLDGVNSEAVQLYSNIVDIRAFTATQTNPLSISIYTD